MMIDTGNLIVGIVIGVFAGFILGLLLERDMKESAAIKHNCASYDTITGEWQWITLPIEDQP